MKGKIDQGACREETTELGLSGVQNTIPLLPAPKILRQLEPRVDEGGTAGERGQTTEDQIQAFVSGEPCRLGGSQESKTAPGQDEVLDRSLDFLKHSEAVIINCWSL